ncbi:unnamed protein product [Urochloa decumbens]|uniref:Uncharacterized protein n=1 Tax=Urochloa decumbens TaxID=240449 RepID=A0ABC9BDZ2_9POAL
MGKDGSGAIGTSSCSYGGHRSGCLSAKEMGACRCADGGSVLEVTLVGSSLQVDESRVSHGEGVAVGDQAVLDGSGSYEIVVPDGKAAVMDQFVGGDGSRSDKIGVTFCSARCSFGQLHDVIQRFDEKKRGLVEEAGFGGLLQFPAIRQVDRRFLVWLMCRVDALTETLVINEHQKIKFHKSDVAKVFGVPCGGLTIPENGRSSKEVVSKAMCDLFGMEYSRCRSIKALQAVLDRDYGASMSSQECAAFKTAFVIYVISTMLSPASRWDFAYVDYWDVIADHCRLADYDWCGYVIRKLVDAVIKLKNDLKATRKVPNITGCALFLQILYLDSIDLGFWSMEHNKFPRISVFPPDRIKCMIRADCTRHCQDRNDRLFGKSKLLLPAKVCYSWGASDLHMDSVINEAELNEIWEATSRVAAYVGAPSKFAVDLYKTVSALDRKVRRKIAGVLSAGMQSFGGFKYSETKGATSFGAAKPGTDDSTYCPYSGNGKRVAYDDSVSCEASRDAAALLKVVRCDTVCDVVQGREDDPNQYPPFNVVFMDPWTLGFHSASGYCCDGDMLRDAWARMCVQERNVLSSWVNKFDYLKPDAIRRQLCGHAEFEAWVVDAVIRSLKDRDAILYAACGKVRWRHIVDSCFMGALLSGKLPMGADVLEDYFGKKVVGYNVQFTKMIFFPALVSCRWVCYGWNRDNDMIYVFDPMLPILADHDVHKFHQDACKLIRAALNDILVVPACSSIQSNNPETYCMVNASETISWVNRSGVGCLLFCSMFDGQVIRGTLHPYDLGSVAGVMVYEALSLLRRING